MNYCRALQFEEEPNYDYLRSILASQMTTDSIKFYDWSVKAVLVDQCIDLYKSIIEVQNELKFKENCQLAL